MYKKNGKIAFGQLWSGIVEHTKSNKKKIFFVVLLIIGAISLIFIKSLWEYNQKYVFENGKLIAIKEDSGLVPVVIISGKDDELAENHILLDTDKVKERAREEQVKNDNEELNTKKLANYVKTSRELRKDGYIILPDAFEEAKNIKWEASFDYSFAGLLFIIPIYIFLDYRRKFEVEEKARKKSRDSIIHHLPSFSDNIVLLLESGLIFTDAFSRIALLYKVKDKCNVFEQMIIDIFDECTLTKDEYTVVMNRHASEIKVREYSRFCNTLIENQRKGIDLAEKLRLESSGLWEVRKKSAAEKGKLAETKLSVPLALLLVALILITAAPAFMQM